MSRVYNYIPPIFHTSQYLKHMLLYSIYKIQTQTIAHATGFSTTHAHLVETALFS